MQDFIGTILDNAYRIDALLGQGGMGAVYKGHDVALNRDVAIKVMHAHIAAQPGFRDRFLQEARAAAALEHPAIVRVHAFSRNPELLYIVMAFVEGQNLRDWQALLTQKGVLLALPEALGIVESVADALAYAHRRGVYHRDIKPGNIILRPLDAGQTSEIGIPYQPVVTDFGLAKLSEGGVHSMTGTAMGTPAYMAPEQCEGLSVDGRADIYALGIVAYELITGRVPFNVKTLTEALRYHTKEPPPPPRSINPDIPSQVEEIVLKALAKQPGERFQGGNDLARALRAARNALARPGEGAAHTTQAGSISLVTLAAQGAPAPAPEGQAWPTPPAEIPPGGRVVILGPGGESMAEPLGERTRMVIGREPGNDIVLPDAKVSRRHAQISVDGNRYTITDLNSTNGTYLGNNKLLPGVPENWPAGRPLRIGDHWLRLEVTQAAQPTPTAGRSTSATAGVAAPPLGGGRSESLVSVALEPAEVRVAPGGAANLTVRILNRQQQVDHFIVMVDGLPGSWVTRPDSPLRLLPGESGATTLRLSPPRAPTSTAGDHSFAVRVIPRANPNISARADGVLQIEPLSDVALSLSPSTFTLGGQGRLRVANQGNVRETVVLAGSDAGELLHIMPRQTQIALPPGQEQVVDLPVQLAGKRPWIGSPQTVPFVVSATSAQGAVTSTQGSFTIQPRLPAWILPFATILFLALCAAVVLGYNAVQQNRRGEATRQAMLVADQTAVVMATEQALGTLTAEAMSAAERQTATAAVATATADWLAADSDGDGLANKDELVWGTSPQNRDTDGDTLTDGQEVSMGISPTSKDTDGDGTQDNVDPAPGQLPSPTPMPTPTPLPTETPAPTNTPEPTPIPTLTPTVKPPSGITKVFPVRSLVVAELKPGAILAALSIFSDNFDDGTLTEWTANRGTWSNPSAFMRGIYTDGDAWHIKKATGDDFSYAGKVNLVSGNAVGLVFRSSPDGTSSYDLILDAEENVIKLSKRSPYQVLASKTMTVQRNHVYQVRVVTKGTLIEAYLDETKVLAVNDSTYSSGHFGVMLFRARAEYDDLSAVRN